MIGAIARVCTIYYLCSMVLKVATPARVVCYLCKESVLSLQGESAIAAGRVMQGAYKKQLSISERCLSNHR